MSITGLVIHHYPKPSTIWAQSYKKFCIFANVLSFFFVLYCLFGITTHKIAIKKYFLLKIFAEFKKSLYLCSEIN